MPVISISAVAVGDALCCLTFVPSRTLGPVSYKPMTCASSSAVFPCPPFACLSVHPQPDFVYTAEGESAVSSVVLQNPYDATITLGTRFLTDAPLVGVITDTHWFQRDRLGRTLAFMARLLTDAWPGSWTSGGSGLGFGLTSMPAVRAIACDEQSAVVIDPVTRHATVLNEDTGPDHACYFMAAAATARRVCLPQTNLTLADVTVFRASSIEGGTFDLGAWAPVAGSGGASYNVSAISGILTSTQAGGALY